MWKFIKVLEFFFSYFSSFSPHNFLIFFTFNWKIQFVREKIENFQLNCINFKCGLTMQNEKNFILSSNMCKIVERKESNEYINWVKKRKFCEWRKFSLLVLVITIMFDLKFYFWNLKSLWENLGTKRENYCHFNFSHMEIQCFYLKIFFEVSRKSHLLLVLVKIFFCFLSSSCFFNDVINLFSIKFSDRWTFCLC